MYEYIKGTIEYVCPEYIVVENNGIGYQVMAPNPFVFRQGKDFKVYTYQHVREDIMALYGFQSIEEKTLFKKLLNVSGIGPKGALAILAFGEPSQVIQAIENENEVFLTKFPGVGKKTARQMILDLKGKLQDVVPDYFPNLFNEEQFTKSDAASLAFEEAMLALKALGYSDKELKKISAGLQKEQLSTDEYIKAALKKLMR
ncbi:Holliday junction branch migration protein RuvA [Heyndrickxia acidicola]|uniref:Holliday junction branch migration complex subunit RuvA n=1 Tax=Heyndrickxia acidicola TaxID=209389 RepID=A0ABU6MNH5_9BACI|nr:Holliday junction branch migration protein RuvA [Heyndrickxia acidicola]MED1204767.1 Holliday junction branch migration protein RuvA [Heyndrickxia acidicola]